MRVRIAVGIACLAVGVAPAVAQRVGGERLAPFVPSPQIVVDRMLEAGDVHQGDMVYDLGCGDGRIVITAAQQFKAKGVGVELSDQLARQARDQVQRMGLQNRVSIVQGDLLDVDLKPADVVTLYLLTDANERLKPILEKSLHPGARVVSHDFAMRGWKPDRIEEVIASRRTHTIYVYLMPPKRSDRSR